MKGIRLCKGDSAWEVSYWLQKTRKWSQSSRSRKTTRWVVENFSWSTNISYRAQERLPQWDRSPQRLFYASLGTLFPAFHVANQLPAYPILKLWMDLDFVASETWLERSNSVTSIQLMKMTAPWGSNFLDWKLLGNLLPFTDILQKMPIFDAFLLRMCTSTRPSPASKLHKERNVETGDRLHNQVRQYFPTVVYNAHTFPHL